MTTIKTNITNRPVENENTSMLYQIEVTMLDGRKWRWNNNGKGFDKSNANLCEKLIDKWSQGEGVDEVNLIPFNK